MLYLLLALFGCLSGVTTVLFGFGGGFVMVPLLYHSMLAAQYTADVAMHIAVATSTCVMVVNAMTATLKHWRAGSLLWPYIWPLAGFIAIGAILGALAVTLAAGDWVRIAFVVYLAVTVLDCLLRRGFLNLESRALPRLLPPAMVVGGGVGIGTIATFLGVGGSVMTVPLLRRRGLSMTQATAMANPLSLPVALVGSLTFIVLAWYYPMALGSGYLGAIDLRALVVLSLGSLLGVRLSSGLIGRIPDRLHAQVYLGLLLLVMLSMSFG